jgi:hypothetical protein
MGLLSLRRYIRYVPASRAGSFLVDAELERIGAALQEQSNRGAAAAAGIVGTGEEGFEFGLQTFIDGLKARIADRAKVAKSVKRARG